MSETKTAKLFRNGASQAVRLPVEFRFSGDEVYAIRDSVTGDVTLTSRPGAKAWRDFFELVKSIDTPGDFLSERPLNQPPQERDLFADEN